VDITQDENAFKVRTLNDRVSWIAAHMLQQTIGNRLTNRSSMIGFMYYNCDVNPIVTGKKSLPCDAR
jgi:hypothetical protein